MFKLPLLQVLQGTNENKIGYIELMDKALALGMTRNQFEESLDMAIHGGVLEQTGSFEGAEIYSFPIFSFFTFMKNGENEERTLADMDIALSQA